MRQTFGKPQCKPSLPTSNWRLRARHKYDVTLYCPHDVQSGSYGRFRIGHHCDPVPDSPVYIQEKLQTLRISVQDKAFEHRPYIQKKLQIPGQFIHDEAFEHKRVTQEGCQMPTEFVQDEAFEHSSFSQEKLHMLREFTHWQDETFTVSKSHSSRTMQLVQDEALQHKPLGGIG